MLDKHMGNGVFAGSALVDVLLVCAAVAWAARRDPLGLRLAVALAVAGALLALKGLLLLEVGLESHFGVMHVIWLDLVLVLPLAALTLLLSRRGRTPVALRAAALACLLLAPVGAYASLIEPRRIEVERAQLRLAPARAGERPLRLGVIADLQFERLGRHERRAVNRLLAQRPDLILLAGDYHQGSPAALERELPGLRALLRRLSAAAPTYAVQGDTEGLGEARRVMAETGVELLVNEVARTRIADRRLTIGGVERDYWSRPAHDTAAELERQPGGDDVRILLAHRPDAVLDLEPRTRVDLVVAGHTHGGQLQLPLLGPPVFSSNVPRRVGAGGLHRLAGRRIYVSRGVGVERGQAPKLRLGAPPEVSLITLR